MKRTSLTTRTLLTAAAVTATLALPFGAQAYSYNYLEGGYVNRDQPGDDDGFRAQGMFDVLSPVAIIAEYADVDYFSQLSVGALYHHPLQRGLDLNLGASFEHVDIDGGGDESGFGLRAGLRWMLPNSKLELNPELRHVEIDNFDATSLRVGAVYPLQYEWALTGGAQVGDDDRFDIGLRYNFGPQR